MSRIGNAIIQVPDGVTVVVDASFAVVARGDRQLRFFIPSGVCLHICDKQHTVSVTRDSDDVKIRSLHGLIRSLVSNNIRGLVQPWEKRLEIVGVGYQASQSNGVLSLSVGFADIVRLYIPVGVVCVVPDATHIVLSSADRQLVGQFAADIRSVRPPEPYKGKGIRYADERVQRKSGKAFGS